ncbi:MAG: hypothetical protein IJI42_04885 [Methanobrevibacter sp.]|nr:hypothetical protein [Methanobrevibacter sp.]
MSNSKFIMAKKLQRVQVALMEEKISSTQLQVLLPLIFKKCLKENMTFWFNFLEDACVLNLRDVEHENTELNIRYAYPSVPLGEKGLDKFKETLLVNAFLITKSSVKVNVASSAREEETRIIDSDEVMPASIRKAIEKIQKKGIPVTVDTIRNHLQLSKMSTSNRIECNRYLKKMEEE